MWLCSARDIPVRMRIIHWPYLTVPSSQLPTSLSGLCGSQAMASKSLLNASEQTDMGARASSTATCY